MQETKVQFSPHEIELMQDGSWILTKNGVMRKMAEGMGSLAERMKEAVGANSGLLPGFIKSSNAKISRGENYRGLPYLMLDYPKSFSKDDIFAIRTFFWWGQFCSIALHVKGRYRSLICNNISSSIAALAAHAFYCSTEGDEWNHDVTSHDYRPVTEDGLPYFEKKLPESGFIKLAAKVSLKQWSEMEEELYKSFRELLKLLIWSEDAGEDVQS
ncbi:MAG: hypothetical protein INR73_16855 [Williamsia sp.]|nr:hypothetical protein [Williamsia sp.]